MTSMCPLPNIDATKTSIDIEYPKKRYDKTLFLIHGFMLKIFPSSFEEYN